ncbi:MAG: sel1 repeat family protein, partial [Magnetococcales bacterium]|nr:sel1 repeat family protein [Magnetococcales bacterium]
MTVNSLWHPVLWPLMFALLASAHLPTVAMADANQPEAASGRTPESLFEQTRQAADQGDAEARMLLGHLYLKGSGVARDPAQALKWYALAAAQGHSEAARHRDQLLPAFTRHSTVTISRYEPKTSAPQPEAAPAPPPDTRPTPLEILPLS